MLASLPSPRVRWVIAESEHFSVLSDAGRDDARRVSRNLEGLYSVLQSIAAEERRGPKTLVYAFRSTRMFQVYNPFPGRNNVAGFFTSSMLRNFLAIDLAKDQRGSTIYHEVLHEFAATNFPGVPLWFNEGLAEYYSTFVLNQHEAEVGRAIQNHLYYLRSTTLLPMRELAKVTTESSEYNESQRSGRFYAQAWATVHYLLSDNSRAMELRDFLRALDSGQDVERAFSEAFRQDFDTFDTRLRSYLDQRSFQFLRIPTEALHIEVSLRAADRSEALSRLGELLAAEQQTGKAREHLLAVLESDSNAKAPVKNSASVANARAILGWLAWMEGDTTEARRLFDQASGDPTSVAARLYRGMLELDLVFREAGIGNQTRQEHPWAKAAQTSLTEALALEPDWPKAQVSLGMSYLYRGEAEKGIEILTRAAELRPQDPMAWLGIAMLSAKSHNYPRAWTLLEQLEALRAQLPGSSTATIQDLLPAARDTVAVFQINRTFDLSNQRNDAAALELAAQLEDRLSTVELERFEPHLKSVRSQIREGRAVARFNEIVSIAKPGKYQHALEMLDDLIGQANFEEIRGGELLLQAENLRKELVRVIER